MNDTLKTIFERSSVRAYDKRDISESHREIIIKSAMRAPTAGNMMLYSILEVTRQSDKEKLVKTCDNQPFIAKAPLVLIFLSDMQRWYDYFEASGVPAMCEKKGMIFEGPELSDLFLSSCDALIAAQNAVIAAESLGIGSCYIGDIMENIETHREMFNLPDLVFPIGMLCFGYKKEGLKKKKLTSRFPEKYIHFKYTYKRIQRDEFDDMFRQLKEERFKNKNFYKKSGAENLGQHYYLNKTGAEFTKEMRRSVNVALHDWVKSIQKK